MPGPDGTPPAPVAGLTAVPVTGIETAIAERWRALAHTMARPRAHARVMTMLVRVEDDAATFAVFDTVKQLAGKHPIRVISVGYNARLANGVRAWVNAGCAGDDPRAVCSEEIVLQGGQTAGDCLLSAVRGLLVPDLPVLLWWRGPDVGASPLWSGLAGLSDRIIVDSSDFGAQALQVLHRVVGEVGAGGRRAVRDLNWQRTAPWRAALATCFDDRAVLAMLDALDRAVITFSAEDASAPPSVRAQLVAGWLCRCVNGLQRHCSVVPGPHWSRDVGVGRVVSIALTSSRSKASLLLVRKVGPTRIDAQACEGTGGHIVRRWSFPAATLTEAELLDGCLSSLGSDPVFEAALQAALVLS